MFSMKQISMRMDELEKIRSSRTEIHRDVLWVDNPAFTDPVTEWYYDITGDQSDAATSFSPNQADIDVIGESYTKQVLLNNDTKSNWQAFNKSDLVVIPTHPIGGGDYIPTYGIDDEGCWCSHYWEEEEDDGQPKNTPRMHWKTNVSLGRDMSDYIINDVSFEAVINASVRWDIDTEGDPYARATNVPINQHETYDWVQFYVEISTIDIGDIPLEESELNTYRIAFNQTELLGNESLLLYDIEGLIGEYGDQAIIDAINNVLAVDPGHDEFCIVLGIYIYCEDNNSGTDQDHWEDLRFKTLDLTFSYQKKIDQSTEISLKQDLDAINGTTGTNVQILDSNLNFAFKIDKSWTTESNNSRIRIFINDRRYDPPASLFLIDYTNSPNFKNASIEGFDITSKLLPYENFTLEIQVLLADTFGLDQNYTISITNVYLSITWSEFFPDPVQDPTLYLGLFILALAAAAIIGGYFIAYYYYFRYPVPIRKVRKYRRTLNKEKDPGVAVIPPGKSFGKVFNKEASRSSKFLKGTPVNGKILKKKITETKTVDKPLDSKKKPK